MKNVAGLKIGDVVDWDRFGIMGFCGGGWLVFTL